MTSDEQRTDIAVKIAAEEVAAGQQVLLLTHRVEHAQRIDAALTSHAIVSDVMLGGEEWKERFDAARAGLRSGKIRAVAGTVQAVGTGIDVPSLSRGVLTTPVGSNRQLYGQIRGRLCRVGKEDAVLYVLWDRHVNGMSLIKRMLSWNRTVRVLDNGLWVDGREFSKR
jgi:superfamily II DNA or RNA helicase